ncbi:arsenic resistance N-acetyltransferase ArsN2 [Nitrogeniibacter aestuarii]|uniref:arsenic resistance N-acetyltransferase ArsN2 n=1 Tax=Nitrogeniibacter aestuarii TaxID=2815343 RepID=UPI001D11F398|nr:arsenic resistance N-acetyltransferase ArsN2 [Nitrogeniibacter aestuarii]
MTTRRISALANLDEACRMLVAEGLPTEDLTGANPPAMFGLFEGEALVGAVGLEAHPPFGLLRSLVVASDHRGRGLAQALIQFIEREAAQAGIRRIFLLTTSSQGFFESVGYGVSPRETAPAAITRTAQFAGLCPASATLMMRALD